MTAVYEMRQLSSQEIDNLLVKLEENDSLGSLKLIPRDKRRQQFEVAYARQILVALLETTHGLPLVEIIANEYKSIVQTEAQLIYLDICSLHRFGPPVRAGLISRIHGITFDEFEEKFFKPLEQIVRLRPDRRSGDYVYEARHPQIAHALYDAILKSQDERFDNLARIIPKLNASYSYDQEVLSHIIRAEAMERTFSDPLRARQVYDISAESMGELSFILHQRGIYELRVARHLSELRTAGYYLEKASERDPKNRSIKHSLAELDLKRSRLSTDVLETRSWRRSAIERAGDLTIGDRSPYPYHTILKARTDALEEALAEVERDETEAATHHLGECILEAEDVLKRGLQKFPDDQSLLSGEGRLAEVLANSVRAEAAFKKAFSANPRSTLIARRLIKILRSKNDYDGCVDVLRQALEANPSSAELHYELARVLLLLAPDADQVNSQTIAYHLRKSFIHGDQNYRAQFWYARQLCIMNMFDEAVPLFARLSDMQMSFAQKSRLQAPIKDSTGANMRYVGFIKTMRSSYGFAHCSNPNMDLFVSLRELDADAGYSFSEGKQISFEIDFSLRGPIALSVKLIE